MKKYYAESELIINPDGSIFHLHVKPEQLADKIILVGDPGRVALVASHFDTIECEVESREFKTITGTYKDKRITVVSTGIGCDNIDIVMNELDALANIDFKSRYEKDKLRQLQLVRIGTCGGLQPYTPVGTYICSEKSIGFDGLLNFMPAVMKYVISKWNKHSSIIWAGKAMYASHILTLLMQTKNSLTASHKMI